MFDQRLKSHHDAESSYKHLLKQRRSSQDELMAYLTSTKCTQEKNAIYVHIPFCDRICTFCNMNRQIKDKTLDEYVDQLMLQITQIANTTYMQSAPIGAIYFGGGTPTTLRPEQLERILIALRTQFKLDEDVEISCETTLHNLSEGHLSVFQAQGVNRLSIGVQTFQDVGRNFFNRTFTKEEVVQRLRHIREVFHGCISIDIIYNYPDETLEMLKDDARMIVQLGIDSVSFYSLMIHDGSVLSKKTQLQLSNRQDELFHEVFIDTLRSQSDFEFLELTKLARSGRDHYRYMHIRNANGNTIPLGRGAGGQIDRFGVYIMDFDRIMIAYSQDMRFDLANKLYGIFQNTAINQREIAIYNISDQIQQLCQQGFLSVHDQNIELTNRGIFYGNNIGGFLVRNYLEQERV